MSAYADPVLDVIGWILVVLSVAAFAGAGLLVVAYAVGRWCSRHIARQRAAYEADGERGGRA